MRILLVSYYFPPVNVIGSVRVGKFAKYLIENGHEVRVLAARDSIYPNDLPLEIPESCVTYTDPIQINLLPYRLVGRAQPNQGLGDREFNPVIQFLGRIYRILFNFPDGQVGWMPSAMKAGRKMVNEWRPDLIYGSAMPFTSLVIAQRLSTVSGTPYVAELRDLWMDSHYYDHPWPRRVIEGRLERATLSRASGLVTVSEPLADLLRLKYGIRTTVVLNGFDPADFEFDDEDETNGAATSEAMLRIVYTGTIYPGRRDPTPLFRALAEMPEDERKQYRVEFYGRRLAAVRQLAETCGISDIVAFHEPVPYRNALKLQASADILLLLLWDVPEESGVYTGKLFEYFGARRPILSIGAERGVAAELISSRAGGMVSNDPAAIRTQLQSWLSQKLAGNLQPLSSGAFEGFTRTQQFRSLTSFLKHTVPDRTSAPLGVHVIVNRLDVGGTERHISQIMPRLDPKRFRVSVQTLRGGGFLEPALKRAGIPVTSPNALLPRWAQRLMAGASLFRRLLFRRPALVHFFLPESYLLGGFVSLMTGQSRMIMSRRSLNRYQDRYPLMARVEKWMHGRITALVGNSRAVVRQLEEETHGNGNVYLIHNGIEVPDTVPPTRRSDVRESMAIPDDTLVFITVANLIPYKGHADLLRGFAEIRDRLTMPWRLYCIGRDDGIGGKLQVLGQELGIGDHIHWEGEQYGIEPYLAIADASILASHEEGFSNSILEGMAASLPMIVTDVGGNAEAVVDGETGFLVPPQNPAAMAEAILRLVGDPELRARMGRAGRERVKTMFSLDRCTREYEKLYTGLAHRR